jgi:hypothetical protein
LNISVGAGSVSNGYEQADSSESLMRGRRGKLLLTVSSVVAISALLLTVGAVSAAADEGFEIDAYGGEFCVSTDSETPGPNLQFRIDVWRKGTQPSPGSTPPRSVTFSVDPEYDYECRSILGSAKGKGSLGPGFWRGCLYLEGSGDEPLQCSNETRRLVIRSKISNPRIRGGTVVFKVRVPKLLLGERFKLLQGQCRVRSIRPPGAPPGIVYKFCEWTKVKRFSRVIRKRTLVFKQRLKPNSTHVQFDIKRVRGSTGVATVSGVEIPFSTPRLVRKFRRA